MSELEEINQIGSGNKQMEILIEFKDDNLENLLSKGKDEEIPFNIDFNRCSESWMRNKKKKDNRIFYICCYRHSNDKRCRALINPPENPYINHFGGLVYQKRNRSIYFCKRHSNNGKRVRREKDTWV